MQKININFWDEFYVVGNDQNNEIQETYAYVEETSYSHDDCQHILTLLCDFIKSNIKTDIDMIVEYHETKKQYTEDIIQCCIDEYGEAFFFERWELKLRDITHEKLDHLIESLNNVVLTYHGCELNVYSES